MFKTWELSRGRKARVLKDGHRRLNGGSPLLFSFLRSLLGWDGGVDACPLSWLFNVHCMLFFFLDLTYYMTFIYRLSISSFLTFDIVSYDHEYYLMWFWSDPDVGSMKARRSIGLWRSRVVELRWKETMREDIIQTYLLSWLLNLLLTKERKKERKIAKTRYTNHLSLILLWLCMC